MENAVGFGKPSVRNFFVYIIWLKIETLPLMPLCYHNVVKTEQLFCHQIRCKMETINLHQGLQGAFFLLARMNRFLLQQTKPMNYKDLYKV